MTRIPLAPLPLVDIHLMRFLPWGAARPELIEGLRRARPLLDRGREIRRATLHLKKAIADVHVAAGASAREWKEQGLSFEDDAIRIVEEMEERLARLVEATTLPALFAKTRAPTGRPREEFFELVVGTVRLLGQGERETKDVLEQLGFSPSERAGWRIARAVRNLKAAGHELPSLKRGTQRVS
jgi:hypothetical protein